PVPRTLTSARKSRIYPRNSALGTWDPAERSVRGEVGRGRKVGRRAEEVAGGAAEKSGGEGREHGTEVTPTRREETIAVCQQCARPTHVRGPNPAVTRSPSTRPTWRPSAPSITSPITSSPSMP